MTENDPVHNDEITDRQLLALPSSSRPYPNRMAALPAFSGIQPAP